jgi:hypothetical protein
MSTFAADQFNAAAREASLRAHRVAQALGHGAQVEELPAGPFTSRLIAECLQRLDARTQTTCRHLRAPGISWLVSWVPDRLLCDQCALASARQTLGFGRPQTCDICQRTVEAIGSVTAVAGPLMVLVATCAPCFTSEERGAGS